MNYGDLLPVIPQPPHDPTSWLLNGRAGWRELTGGLQQVEKSPATRSLELAPPPGSARLLMESSGSFGGLTPPANVALGPDGSIYLLDRRALTLKRFDPCECRFVTVPCFGGEGAGSRQLRHPGGIGICSGNLCVCDTGNGRISVFALRGFTLRGHWRPPASANLNQPWQPVAVTFDGQCRVYVADSANGIIHRFSRAGKWEKPLAGFGKAIFLATDCRDRLYVVSEGERQARVVNTDGDPLEMDLPPAALAPHFSPMPFVVDIAGNLHLGPLCQAADACASPPTPGAPERGVFDLQGEPGKRSPPPPMPAYQPVGTYYSQALDSELYRCQWHRVVLRGRIPDGARIRAWTYTAEALQADDQILNPKFDRWETNQVAHAMEKGEWDCLVRSGGGRYLWLRLELQGDGNVTPSLESVQVEFPRISLRRYLPAEFGADPAGADFTDRFLSLFDTTLRSIEQKLDTQALYFDPLSAPAERDPKTGLDFLTWLGTWIGWSLDRHWPEAKRRQFLKRAGSLYDLRGTRTGLWRQLLLFLGMEAEMKCCPEDQPKMRCQPEPANCRPIEARPCAWQPPPLILEHYQLRRWLFVGAGRLGDQAVLWGKRIVNRSQLDGGAQVGSTKLIETQDPYRDPFHFYAHKFTVFAPARYSRSEQDRKALENLLKSESPSHTQHQIQYVEPRFRIGVQSAIGLDSVIGRIPQGVRLNETPLREGSVLGAPPHEQGGPSFAIGKWGRVGTTTRLD